MCADDNECVIKKLLTNYFSFIKNFIKKMKVFKPVGLTQSVTHVGMFGFYLQMKVCVIIIYNFFFHLWKVIFSI